MPTTLKILAPLQAALLMMASPQAIAQEDARVDRVQSVQALQSILRVGTEYDDNALRLAEDRRADWLTRYFASLDLAVRLPSSQDNLTLSLSQGGKLFFEERAANTLLTQAGLSWQHRIDQTTWPIYTRLQVDLKDRTENVSLQDYYRAGALGGLGLLLPGGLVLEGRAGGRLFAFKPNPAASSRGFATNALVRRDLPFDLSALIVYSWLQRRFDIAQQVRARDQGSSVMATRDGLDEDIVYLTAGERVRQDFFQSVLVQLGWQGPALVSATYTYSANRSNSYGQDLQRHNVGVGVTALLPIVEVLLATRLELQRTRYDDPVLLDANFLIDEDNRNMGTLSLVRPLWGGFELECRASVYLQEFGGSGDYRRRTIMLAIGHQFAAQSEALVPTLEGSQ